MLRADLIYHRFSQGLPKGQGSMGQGSTLLLPFALSTVIDAWEVIMKAMLQKLPDDFSRSEWAYLASFLQPTRLKSVFTRAFGHFDSQSSHQEHHLPGVVYKPRGHVSIWLPANVSLLGPLSIILVSISGNSLQLKGSPRGENLTESFLAFVKKHAPLGALRNYLHDQVKFEVFERDDARNRDMSSRSDVRIVFGSDTASAEISQLLHKPSALTFGFTARQSETWMAAGSYNDADIEMLVKVFSVYGQAGCTSPKRVVLINGQSDEIALLSLRIINSWNSLNGPRPEPHLASSSIFASQMGAVKGWQSMIADDNRGCLLTGGPDLPLVDATPALHLVCASIDKAGETTPPNIQTIGYVCPPAKLAEWGPTLFKLPVKRLVPLSEMHHFGPIWDGFEFWRDLFEAVEVR
jgi:hypothetical protein